MQRDDPYQTTEEQAQVTGYGRGQVDWQHTNRDEVIPATVERGTPAPPPATYPDVLDPWTNVTEGGKDG